MEPFLEGPLLAEIWMIDSQNPEDDVFAKAVVRPEQKQLQPLKTPARQGDIPRHGMKIRVAQLDAYGSAGVTLSFEVIGHPHAERGKNFG